MDTFNFSSSSNTETGTIILLDQKPEIKRNLLSTGTNTGNGNAYMFTVFISIIV